MGRFFARCLFSIDGLGPQVFLIRAEIHPVHPQPLVQAEHILDDFRIRFIGGADDELRGLLDPLVSGTALGQPAYELDWIDNIFDVPLLVRELGEILGARRLYIERYGGGERNGLLYRSVAGAGDDLEMNIALKAVLAAKQPGHAVEPVHRRIGRAYYPRA